MTPLVVQMVTYNAWANRELFRCLNAAPASIVDAPTLQVIEHYCSIAGVFASRLGAAKDISPSNEAQTLDSLSAFALRCDEWLVSFTTQLAPDRFEEQILFTFLDGNRGCMSQGEILMHIALHSALHRGEVYRLLQGRNIDLPWDTFAVFLHETEPARRTQSAIG